MSLAHYVGTLNLLGDESRIRLCALLRERELSVTDLVRVTGHLPVARLDPPRRACAKAASCATGATGRSRSTRSPRTRSPARRRPCSTRPPSSADPTLEGDQQPAPGARGRAPRRAARVVRRRDASATTRPVAPGSRSPSGIARAPPPRRRARRRLGRRRGRRLPRAVLPLAHLHRHQRAHDRGRQASASPRHAHVARPGGRRARPALSRVVVRLGASSFTRSTYAEHPPRALEECARVLRPGGRVVVLSLDEHEQARRHGALRRAPRRLLAARPARRCSPRAGLDVDVRRGRLPRGARSRTSKSSWPSPRSPSPAPPKNSESRESMTAPETPSARSSSSSSRIAIIDGAMGTTIRTYGMKEADIRGERFADVEEGPAQQRRPLLAHAAEDDLRHPPALPRGRRRHHRDQHLRRDQHRRRASSSSTTRASTAAARTRPSTRRSSTTRSSTISPGRSTSSRRGSAASGPTASATPTASGASSPAPSDRSPSRSPTRPTPTTPGFRVVTFDQVKAAYVAAGPRAHRGRRRTCCSSRRSSTRSTPRRRSSPSQEVFDEGRRASCRS